MVKALTPPPISATMDILCPVNRAEEVPAVIEAGATELYCGVMPTRWRKSYTNMASPNRREWDSSNLQGFDQLRAVIDVAHDRAVPVYITLNALYTAGQYDALKGQIEEMRACGVDAAIVADVGMMLTLRDRQPDWELHVSTGGTTFNSETVAFFKGLGVRRIVLPRHYRIDEMAAIAQRNPDVRFEAFIMNRGCKNIDGFCTFHHGVNEVRFRNLWKIPKKLNADKVLLTAMHRLPRPAAESLARAGVFGSVGACFLNYDVKVETSRPVPAEAKRRAKETISSSFNLLTGIDTCGGCAIRRLVQGGVTSLKIVGRNNLTSKKVKDIRYLKGLSRFIDDPNVDDEAFRRKAKTAFRDVFGYDCGERCYYH